MCGTRRLSIVLAALILCLAASLLANLWLIRWARHYARLAYSTRLDPIGRERYPSGQETAAELGAGPADLPRVVLFGDSRAQQWPAPEANGAWVVINRGIDGQSTLQALERFDAHIDGLEPAVVVVQLGVNDLVALALMPGDRERIVAACKEHLRQVVARARAQGATVVVTTIVPPGHPPPAARLFWSEAIPAAIAEVNAYLVGLAGDGVLVLDTAAVLAGADGRVRPAYQADHLHLNRAGYDALNAALIPVVRGALRAQQ